MGQRGGSWVIAQVVLFILFAVAPQIGSPWPGADIFRLFGWILVIVGVLLFAQGAINLGRSLTPFPRPLPDGRLVTTGAYRFVRHPIYSSVVLGALGLSLVSMSPVRLALTIVLFVFFDLKARREEQWLQEKYPEYAAYKSRVKKLIPWVY